MHSGGDKSFVVARPMLYDLLLRQIPPHKIHMGKRVTSLTQNKSGVMIRCTDNQSRHGDILVGADGAYSGVCQSLYKQLNDENLLPSSDDGVFPFSCTCLVGQTEIVDTAQFPEIISTDSHYAGISSLTRHIQSRRQKQPGFDRKKRVAFTARENTVCWPVVQHLGKNTAKDNDTIRNSEWAPEAAEAVCKEVGHLRIPGGSGNLTLKDLFDITPKNLISKVMIEEKVFDISFYQRTVHPASGQGAINAMQDAITLANVIASLPSKEVDDIAECFKIYKYERYPLGALVRYSMKHMPQWLNMIAMAKLIQVRPQVNFLPRAEDKGTVKAKYRPSLHRKVTFAAPPTVAPAAVEAPTVV
ncbi:hypothetical protein BG000_001342 [Podila horticola]|nr:hypothetical protein BG000_001342 [Podila horticola]